ncbi:MAG: PorV/PorQ family protein [Dehalococcoidales bacterium]|nr:PorV/PorQ family protein [Dehalococcoidales bacterium]
MRQKSAAERATSTLLRLTAGTACALLACLAPAAAGGPGSAGMQVLKTDMSPRAAGMGGAFVAVADDIYAMNYNPAGLGQLYIPEATAMYLSGFDDSKLNYLAYGMPLPFIGLAGLEKPGAGISLMLSDAGKFNYRYINPDGSVFSHTFDAQKDLALSFGYGEKVYSDEVNLEGYKAKIEQYLGMNVKYIRSTLLEDKQPPSTLAFDAGWLMMEPNLGVSLAASIANYGGGLKYGSETTKLPGILRLGASWQKPTVMDQSLLLAAEGDFYTAEALKSIRFGLEYQFEKIFSLRTGYKAEEDNKGMTMGLGVRYENFSLDFGLSLGGEVYNASQVSFSYTFSGWRSGELVKKPRQYKDARSEPGRKAQPARRVRAEPEKRRKAEPEKPQKKDSDFFWIY